MKLLTLILTLGAFGAALWLCDDGRALGQSGRVSAPKTESKEERSESPEVKSSRLVLGLMKREEMHACGLTKLSEEELDRLDRWILQLMLTMSALPTGELRPRSLAEEGSRDLQRQQMELELNDLRQRLTEIRQASAQLLLDLSRARLAAQRRDALSVETFLFSAEGSAMRIQRAAQ
ncbi:MAG: hypothetical protein N0A16_11535 [Blastocatellia bacterium]|nr:hypothetical protein [Blastocatellia bacterium]MCS7158347.1 hypothetical protein [Blastocatellia bacterium]MCX7752853.1 hypothetical protein [Blastocatellia bacterium]MDW8167909.1 hypothetical protein [Acidobacteriota bacterium]MDW8255934.1 hypothetical protein [Acidobacteriota bacterium]